MVVPSFLYNLEFLVPTAECNRPRTWVKDVIQTPGELQIIESKCFYKFLTFLTIICPLNHSSKNILIPQVVFSTFITILSHTKLLYLYNKEVFYHLKSIQGLLFPSR